MRFLNKVHTAYYFGNSVRIFVVVFLFMQFLFSCTKDNLTVTEEVMTNVAGDWNVAENSTTYGPQNYVVNISKTSEITISIKNFFDHNVITLDVEVDGYKFNIPSQTAGSFVIAGSGTISNSYKKIDWTYTVTDESEAANCTAVYTR
jgi:hypothetical protein